MLPCTVRVRRLVALLVLAFALAATDAARAAEPVPADLRARVERYLTLHFRLSPRDSVEVLDAWPVERPPLWGVSVRKRQGGKTDEAVYMLSRDLKTLALGRVLDFSRDLAAETRSKLRLDGAPALGSPSAPVTLVMFCDLQCSDCAAMSGHLRQVLPDYAGRVRVVFKNFPLMNSHPWAETAALGARCAFEQRPEAFWAFYDFFYTRQRDVSVTSVRDVLARLAGEAQLDPARFAACLDAPATLQALKDDVFDAARLGVRGTPTLVVGGRFIFDEELEEADYRKLFDEALAGRW